MRDETLILTNQPKYEYGTTDSDFPTNVLSLPDDWLDGLSDLIGDIFFIENDEEFESRLRRLEPFPGASLIQESLDPLGMYYPSNKTIKIDENKIHRCANNMQAQGAKATYDHLSKIIAIHEESHALHHLAGDTQKNNDIWDQFINTPSYVLEMLAQLFTYHEVTSDTELLDAFYELEKRQPIVYHLWRLFRKCPKERLYWCIRDGHHCVLRIIKILEYVGLLKTLKIGKRTVWQVAAGDTNRNYADLCLEWDVILNGPGSKGSWPGCRHELENLCTSKKVTDIKRFCEDIADDNIIILRLGTMEVWGVGVVVGDYQWNEDFGDVDGWELQHIRRVRWIWKYNENNPKAHPKKFPAYSLNFGDTTQRIDYPIVNHWIETIPLTNQKMNRPIAKLPQGSPKIMSMDEIADYLFAKGVGSSSIGRVTDEIKELIRIAKWYDVGEKHNPSEAETVSYLVIPLLRALGWTPQKMAIEWGNVDLALFKSLPRDDKTLLAVVEAKPKGFSCLNAREQAHGYTKKTGRDECKRLIVTDGIRYGIYLRDPEHDFKKYPDAYLNITRMRESYPILHPSGKCDGAKEAFYLMSADWYKE